MSNVCTVLYLQEFQSSFPTLLGTNKLGVPGDALN